MQMYHSTKGADGTRIKVPLELEIAGTITEIRENVPIKNVEIF